MKTKLLAILNLLDVFGIKTSDKVRSITIIAVLILSLFNFQVNVNKDDYGYLNSNSDTTIVVEADSTLNNYIDLLLISPNDSVKLDSIKVK